MISIIDCHMGNIGSIVNIIKHIGFEAKIITNADEVLDAEKLILPGVGHWDNGIEKIHSSGLKSAILSAVNEKNIPLLGICLGMQLLFKTSEEGDKEALNLIPGRIKKFDFSSLPKEINQGKHRLRIPHMGWNDVYPCHSNDPILSSLDEEMSFYFVHSFHAADVPEEYQLLKCHYGYDFICAVNKKNVWGFQFHPEKSHKFGMQLLKNFVEKV